MLHQCERFSILCYYVTLLCIPQTLHRTFFSFSVLKPNGVTFVDAAGCVGDAVKAYTALHYLGRLISGDTGKLMVAT